MADATSANRSVAAVIVQGTAVLLARRLPGGAIGDLWEFPGGKVDQGESATAALARELHEELGVAADVHELLAEGRFAHRGVPFELFAYRVTIHHGGSARGGFDSVFALSEHSETRWVAWDDVSSYDMPESDRTVWPIIHSRLRERAATRNPDSD